MQKVISTNPIFVQLMAEQPPGSYIRGLFGMGHLDELMPGGSVQQALEATRVIPPHELMRRNFKDARRKANGYNIRSSDAD